jgi:hypothetical protein
MSNNIPYYENRRKANQYVDEMYNKGTEPVIIKYKVGSIFGFGDKFVDNRIQKLKEITDLKINDNKK